MHKAGLRGCPKRCLRVTTKSGLARAEYLLEQDFSAEMPNERWASDITFIWSGQGWLYLAVVIELYSRRIIGWSMSRRINRHHVLNALSMALDQRRPGYGLIHHSDSKNVAADSFWRSDLFDVRHDRISEAGRPRAA